MINLERALNVRKEELLPASLLGGYLMLVMGCFVMGKSVADSLFLDAFPDALPWVILGTAVVIAGFVSVYIRLSRRILPQRLVPGVLLFFAFSYLVFGVLAYFRQKWVYVPTYLWVYSAGAMCPTMGWTLANYALTTREARRLFGLIGAGPILGGACAGFITAALGKRVSTETMLMALAALQALAALPVLALFRRAPQRMAGLAATAGQKAPRDFSQSCRLLLDSRYLLLITALIAASGLCTTIADFQFKKIAQAHYADKESLQVFFARCYGWMGLGSFLLQLMLTGRLLRAFGIRVTLFIMPAVLAAGSAWVLVLPSLLSAIMLRGSQHVLRYSVDKSSLELLHLPVSPELKASLKPFIDSFIWRLADGAAGLVLILFTQVLHFTPHRLSWVNFVFLACWVVIADSARRGYLAALKEAIQRRSLDPVRMTINVLDQTTAHVVAGSLESDESRQVLYGLSLLDLGRGPGWHPYLRALLSHPAAAVRQRAVALLCDGNDRTAELRIEEMLRDESPEVRGEALHYLVAHAGRDPTELLMRTRGEVPGDLAQSSVVVYLVRHGTEAHREGAQFLLQQMLDQKGREGAGARTAAARVLGMIPAPFPMHAALAGLLRDEEHEVAEQALSSAGKIRSRDLLPGVIENLSRPRLAMAAVQALMEYGDRIVGTLQDCLNDESLSLEVRRQIPNVLGRIPSRDSARVLTESIVQGNPGLRFEILRALNRLRRQDPGLVPASPAFEDLLNAELMGYYRSLQVLAVLHPSPGRPLQPGDGESLLIRIVRERMSMELERIFLLLALIYPQRDVMNAYYGLNSRQARLRENSLEVLENMVKSEIGQALACAVDPEVPLERKAVFAERICRTRVETRSDALRILLHSEDRWLRLSAVYEMGEKCIAGFLDELRTMACSGDPVLMETLDWTVDRLSLEGSL